jgi:hypothetical protein
MAFTGPSGVYAPASQGYYFTPTAQSFAQPQQSFFGSSFSASVTNVRVTPTSDRTALETTYYSDGTYETWDCNKSPTGNLIRQRLTHSRR